MKLLTRRDRAKRAAEGWKYLYYQFGSWGYPKRWSRAKTPTGKTAKSVHAALVSLGDSPDPDAVDALTGSKDYTWLVCDVCDRQVEEVVVCDELELTSQFCCQCILKMMMLIEP